MRTAVPFLALLSTLAPLSSAEAQRAIRTAGSPESESFAGYRAGGFVPAPAAGQLDSDSWRVIGMSDAIGVFGGTHLEGDFTRGTSSGGVLAGGVYHFDSGGLTDALGFQPSNNNFAPGSLTYRLRNNTGRTLDRVRIDFTFAYRNDEPSSTRVTFRTSTNDVTYTAAGRALVTPTVAATSPSWVTSTEGVEINVSLAPGALFYVQWLSEDAMLNGTRDEIALDDIVVTGFGDLSCSRAADCDDGDPCTVNRCSGRRCTTSFASRGTSCSDGNPCNGAETCNSSGTCSAGTPLSCDDSNPCTTDRCDTSRGCLATPVATGTSCSDRNTCNGAEACDGAGRCAPGTPLNCDDANVCTSDRCDPSAGCQSTPLAAGSECGNGDICDGPEVCDGAGRCASTGPLDCNDDDGCTADSCDATRGCLHEVIPMCSPGADAGAGVDAGAVDGGPTGDGGPDPRDGSLSDGGSESDGRRETRSGCTVAADAGATPMMVILLLLCVPWRRRRG